MSKLQFTLALLCPQCGQRGSAEWTAEEEAADPAQCDLAHLSDGFRSEPSTDAGLAKIFCGRCQAQLPD